MCASARESTSDQIQDKEMCFFVIDLWLHAINRVQCDSRVQLSDMNSWKESSDVLRNDDDEKIDTALKPCPLNVKLETAGVSVSSERKVLFEANKFCLRKLINILIKDI